MAGQFLKWRGGDAVPHKHLRDNYRAWIEDFLRCEDLLEKRYQKERDREEVKAAHRSLADVKKSFLSSLKNFVENVQVSSLKAFINRYARHPDMANELRGEHLDSPLRVFSLWPDEIIDRAFSELSEVWPGNSVTDAERKKRLNAIDRDIKKINDEIKKYPDFPIWREFVGDWRALNNKISSGCDLQGFDIRGECRPGDKDAFKKLNMAAYNNPKSNFLPAAAN